MCCTHHVGRKYFNEVTDCKKKCSGLINGFDWTLTQKKGEKGFEGKTESKPATTQAKTKESQKKTTSGQTKDNKTPKGRKQGKKSGKKQGKGKNIKTDPDALLNKLSKED